MKRRQVVSKKEVNHANFHIPKDIYQKFRILAAERTIPISKLYVKAATEFVEKEFRIRNQRLLKELNQQTYSAGG